MTLPPFELHRPASCGEATEMMDRYGETAAFYCGGTELLLAMKLGLAQYDHLISIRHLPELRGLRVANGTLSIGATTTHRQLERSPVVREHLPALAEMARQVANIRVRSAGTLGGNLCFADPHSDPSTFLLATGADLICRRGGDTRVVPLDAFLLGPYQTVLAPGELLGEVRIPLPAKGAAVVHKKLSFHERPAATVTCLVHVEDGLISQARLAVGSVGVMSVRAREAEALLLGLQVDAPGRRVRDLARVEAAAEGASVAAQAVEDSNGSPDYKENLVRVLVKRCFAEAVSRISVAPATGA